MFRSHSVIKPTQTKHLSFLQRCQLGVANIKKRILRLQETFHLAVKNHNIYKMPLTQTGIILIPKEFCNVVGGTQLGFPLKVLGSAGGPAGRTGSVALRRPSAGGTAGRPGSVALRRPSAGGTAGRRGRPALRRPSAGGTAGRPEQERGCLVAK